MAGQLSIIHLKQQHRDGRGTLWDDEQEETRNKVVFSQYHIAKYIINNNDGLPYIVLNEGANEDSDADVKLQLNGEICAAIRQEFPHGLPRSFSSLDENQSIYLFHYGATIILLCTKYIDKFYQTRDQKLAKTFADTMNANVKLASDIENGLIQLSSKEIEERIDQIIIIQNKPAIEYSKIAQEKYIMEKSKNVQKVFLIFGKLHDFSPICAEFKYNLTEVDFIKIVTPSIFGFYNNIDVQHIEREVVTFTSEEFEYAGKGSCLEA